MALFGVPAYLMKPAALTMNIVVAGFVFMRLWRAGYFNARLFWPLALGSVPFAFVGGAIQLQERAYQYLVALALLVAAWRLLISGHESPAREAPPLRLALPMGAGLGFVSGLTGVGGGIFLSPLLLFLRWANMRTTAAVSAAFILVNSISGLAGLLTTGVPLPDSLPWMMLAALGGALVGSELAVRRLAPVRLRQLLGVVLIIAAVKMVLTA